MSRHHKKDPISSKDIWTYIEELQHKQNSIVAEKSNPTDESAEISNDQEVLTAKEYQLPGYIASKENDTNPSTFLMVVGPMESGKSTAMSLFLNPAKSDVEVKPTVALEYTYGRKTSSTGDKKDLCQIWELGGGPKLQNLIPIAITPERFPHTTFIIVADLSTPETAFRDTFEWTKRIRGLYKKPQMVILGTKYDKFVHEDGLKRKALCQALRYIGYLQRASIVFTSKSDASALNTMRTFLNHFAFRTDKKRSLHVDPMKPLVISAGRDSIDKIGLPPGTTAESPADSIVKAFEVILQEYWPNGSKTHDEMKADDEIRDEKLDLSAEPLVDEKRKQKEKDLEKYREQEKRKQKFSAT